MAARGRELKVFLTSDVSKFGRGLRQAEKPLSRFKRFAGGALVGVAAAASAAAVTFGVEGVQAAVADEKATKKLAKTMQNLGKAQDVDKAEDFIESLSRQTGIADDELRPAFEKLIGATGDTDTAMGLLTAAVDTAVGSGKDLATTSAAIAKAAGPGGTAGALKKLIPGLDATAIKGGDANSIMLELNKRFGGQAASNMETVGGKWDAIGTAFGEVQEAFGKGLLGNLTGANDSMGGMDDTLYTLAPNMEELGKTMGDIAVSLATVAQVIGPIVAKFNELNDMGDGILTNGSLATTAKAWAMLTDPQARLNAQIEGAGGVVNGPNATSTGLTPSQLAGKWANSPTNPDFYANGGMPRSVDPNRYKARADDADARAIARGTKTRANP